MFRLTLAALICCFLGTVYACGGVTHTEISYRALYNYVDIHDELSYSDIAQQHQDALEAGSTFPDAFYPNECFSGKYHDVSEDTHWTPFINASITYIGSHYPKPWDQNTQKLVAFIMGVQSHQVADVSWHSLGINQGFLQTMAKMNFHGDFASAHSVGDLGGDVLNLFQLDLSYSKMSEGWYLPVADLLNIYEILYGADRLPENVLLDCSRLLYLVKIVERIAVKEYFPVSAKSSPFLVSELYNYFLGGIDDMAAWTQGIWRHLSFALENGPSSCNMDYNPLFFRCNGTTPSSSLTKNRQRLKNGYYSWSDNFYGLKLSDVNFEKLERGVIIKPGSKLKKKLQMIKETSHHKQTRSRELTQESVKQMRVEAAEPELPKLIITTSTNYSRLGSSYVVADLDSDGNDDVIIGAPGFPVALNQQNGAVFILFGDDNGLNLTSLDISEAADVKILGPSDGIHAQFGSSLAVLDLDKDGKLDIVVGSPRFGADNLTYTGKVYIYSPLSQRQYQLTTVLESLTTYCNLGSSLTTADLNSDGYNDLIVVSQFCPGGGEQRGTVDILFSDEKYSALPGHTASNLPNQPPLTVFLRGSQNYSWLGHGLKARSFAGSNLTYIAVGEPGFRKCARANCSFDPADVQSMGQVLILSVRNSTVVDRLSLQGTDNFQSFGTQLAFGRPYDQFTNVVAITAAAQSVDGHVLHVPVKLDQVGSVYLYNLTGPSSIPITVFSGDREFGRFGQHLQFSDINRDGFDDLIIGAPLRTEDFTEELEGAEQGRVYLYLGGPGFPRGDATSNCGLLELVDPCPAEKAWRTLQFKENYARFGSQVAVLFSKNVVTVLVTAEHSSKGGRLSGAIGVFEF